VVTAHFLGKKSRDIFNEYPSEFACHQISAPSPLYITLFEITKQNPSNGNGSVPDSTHEQKPVVADLMINSEAELEQTLANILQALTIKNPGSAILISIWGSVFYKQHGQTISKTLDRLKLNGNFPKFIQSCRSFKLGQTAKGWQVAIAYP
jgi:hypothetical protein